MDSNVGIQNKLIHEEMNDISKLTYYMKNYENQRERWEFAIGFYSGEYILLLNKIFEEVGYLHLNKRKTQGNPKNIPRRKSTRNNLFNILYYNLPSKNEEHDIWDLCQINKNQIAFGLNNNLCIWDLPKKQEIIHYSHKYIYPLKDAIISICYISQNNKLIIASWNKQIYVLDIKNGKLLFHIHQNELIYQLIGISEEKGNVVIGCSSQSNILIWNSMNMHLIREIKEEFPIYRISLLPDRQKCILTSNMQVWNWENGELVAQAYPLESTKCYTH